MSPLPDMAVRLLLRAPLQRPGPAARPRPSPEHLWPGADRSQLARYREHLGFAADARPLSYLYLAAPVRSNSATRSAHQPALCLAMRAREPARCARARRPGPYGYRNPPDTA